MRSRTFSHALLAITFAALMFGVTSSLLQEKSSPDLQSANALLAQTRSIFDMGYIKALRTITKLSRVDLNFGAAEKPGVADGQELLVPFSTLETWRRTVNGYTKPRSRGDKSESIKALQSMLAYQNFLESSEKIDGRFGKKTQRALVNYQIATGLDQHGELSGDTLELVNDFMWKQFCPTPEKAFKDHSYAPVGHDIGLPSGYAPHDLQPITGSIRRSGPMCLRAPAARALSTMHNAALAEGIELYIFSSFRRQEIQQFLRDRAINQGRNPDQSIAKAGHSEHQLGTAIDLSSKETGFTTTTYDLDGTRTQAWLDQNAHRFGFVLSYPKDQRHIHGYVYEPWHWRYVGPSIASYTKQTGRNILEVLRDENLVATLLATETQANL